MQFLVTAPTGQKFKISAPEGATQEQALAYAQQQFEQRQAPPEATQNAFEAPQETVMEGLGRAAKSQAGAFVKGAADLVALPTDTLVRLLNAAGVTHWKPAADSINEAIDSITPPPRNATERVTNAVVGSLGGAAGGIRAGAALGGAVGDALAAGPGGQLAGAVTGGTASQLAAEAGASPIAQTIAGMVSGAAPSVARAGVAATTKAVVRGGEAGRARTQQTIADFERSGTMPSVGQATGSRAAQAAESMLSKTPGGAGVMSRFATSQAEELGAGIGRQATNMARGASGEQAGRAIEHGVNAFTDATQQRATQLYNELDNHIAPTATVPIANTQRVLANLTRVTPGAPATSQRLINPHIAQIEQDLAQDAVNGVLPYEALRRLRTQVRDQIDNSTLTGDVSNAQWQRLHAALSQDLGVAAQQAGPQAQRAFTRANTYYRVRAGRLEALERVVNRNGGPEAIFQAATSGTKEGATTLRAVMQSLFAHEQRMVTATVLRRLGRAKAGVQDAAGDTFSSETFLTNWNTLSPEAKVALFNRYGDTFRRDMDRLANVASNLRDGSKVFRNPSGTGQAATQIGAVASFLTALVTGHAGGAALIGAGVTGANLSARLLTNPTAVRWLAQRTREPQSAIPAMLTQLSRSKDLDLKDLGEALQKQQEQANE